MSHPEDQKPTVIVLSAPDESPWPGLEPLGSAAEVRHVTEREELAIGLAVADVLIVTDFRTTIVKDAWPTSTPVQWVHATSAGIDALQFPELLESDIVLTNARGTFDDTIAEYVMGLVLQFCKDFRRTDALQRSREWRHRETERVAGQEALIVGAGSIGTEIGRRLKCVGMDVIGVARSERKDPDVFGMIRSQDDLDELLPSADFVILAAPLTDETRGMFGAEAFGKMKASAKFINIARGPLVQTDALVEALRNEKIAGAALDVFEEEPLAADHPLWGFSNVFVSPHMSGDFFGWREALSRQFIDNFERWRRGEALENVVDKGRVLASG